MEGMIIPQEDLVTPTKAWYKSWLNAEPVSVTRSCMKRCMSAWGRGAKLSSSKGHASPRLVRSYERVCIVDPQRTPLPLLLEAHFYKEYIQNRRGVPGSRGPWGIYKCTRTYTFSFGLSLELCLLLIGPSCCHRGLYYC